MFLRDVISFLPLFITISCRADYYPSMFLLFFIFILSYSHFLLSILQLILHLHSYSISFLYQSNLFFSLMPLYYTRPDGVAIGLGELISWIIILKRNNVNLSSNCTHPRMESSNGTNISQSWFSLASEEDIDKIFPLEPPNVIPVNPGKINLARWIYTINMK